MIRLSCYKFFVTHDLRSRINFLSLFNHVRGHAFVRRKAVDKNGNRRLWKHGSQHLLFGSSSLGSVRTDRYHPPSESRFSSGPGFLNFAKSCTRRFVWNFSRGCDLFSLYLSPLPPLFSFLFSFSTPPRNLSPRYKSLEN